MTQEAYLQDCVPVSLAFELPLEGEIAIPTGILTCCRVTHHPDCANAIVKSIVGAIWVARSAGGDDCISNWMPFESEGDVLQDPNLVFAHIKPLWDTAHHTVEQRNQVLVRFCVEVWCLTPSQAARYESCARVLDVNALSGLPFYHLDLTDGEQLANVTGDPSFAPVATYAAMVPIVPSEYGRTDQGRYLTEWIVDSTPLVASPEPQHWDAGPPVEVVASELELRPPPRERTSVQNGYLVKEADITVDLVDGTSTDLHVRASYEGKNEEPIAITYTPITPRG
jgi:hypothetical protein